MQQIFLFIPQVTLLLTFHLAVCHLRPQGRTKADYIIESTRLRQWISKMDIFLLPSNFLAERFFAKIFLKRFILLEWHLDVRPKIWASMNPCSWKSWKISANLPRKFSNRRIQSSPVLPLWNDEGSFSEWIKFPENLSPLVPVPVSASPQVCAAVWAELRVLWGCEAASWLSSQVAASWSWILLDSRQ